jgi:hypothetical protein
MLGCIEERFLGPETLGETCRADFAAELAAVPDRNANLVETFPFGVAFHHAGEMVMGWRAQDLLKCASVAAWMVIPPCE